MPSAVRDRLAFLNDRLSLKEASSYFGELFVLKYEAKRTWGGSSEEGGSAGLKGEEEMKGGKKEVRDRVIYSPASASKDQIDLSLKTSICIGEI